MRQPAVSQLTPDIQSSKAGSAALKNKPTLKLQELFKSWISTHSDADDLRSRIESIIGDGYYSPTIPHDTKRIISDVIGGFLGNLFDQGMLDFVYRPGVTYAELGAFSMQFRGSSNETHEWFSASVLNPVSIRYQAKTFVTDSRRKLVLVLSELMIRTLSDHSLQSDHASAVAELLCKKMAISTTSFSTCAEKLMQEASMHVDTDALCLVGSLFAKPNCADYLNVKNSLKKVMRAIEQHGGLAAFRIWDIVSSEVLNKGSQFEDEVFAELTGASTDADPAAFATAALKCLDKESQARIRNMHPRVAFKMLRQFTTDRPPVDVKVAGLPDDFKEFLSIANDLLKLDINHGHYLAYSTHLKNLNWTSKGRVVAIVKAFDRVVKENPGVVTLSMFSTIGGDLPIHFQNDTSEDRECALIRHFCLNRIKENPPVVILNSNGVKRQSYEDGVSKDVGRAVRIMTKMSFDDVQRHAFKVPSIASEVFERMCAENDWTESKWRGFAIKAIKAKNPKLLGLIVEKLLRVEGKPDPKFIQRCISSPHLYLVEDGLVPYLSRLDPSELSRLYDTVKDGQAFIAKRLLLRSGHTLNDYPDERFIHPAMKTLEYESIIKSAMIRNLISDAPKPIMSRHGFRI